MSLYSDYFSAADVQALFSDDRQLDRMLRFEAALARAQAEAGVFPQDAADVITSCCGVDRLDQEEVKSGISLAGNAAIPLVKQLTRQVEELDPVAAGYVHLGATSQDVVDTSIVLLIQEVYAWIQERLARLDTLLIDLTLAHRFTYMVGRTLLQHARPIPFGLKTAYWLDGLRRCMHQFKQLEDQVFVIQLGGAVGSRNSVLNEEVCNRTAALLGLRCSLPWHTCRTGMAEWASAMAVLCGFLGKVARDISLLMQTEIGEVFEGAAEGRGVSSAMPHKRNPVLCAAILANAARTPHLAATVFSTLPQAHERSLGSWHAEWDVMIELLRLSTGSIERMIDLIQDLEIDADRMDQNMKLTNGLIYSEDVVLALAPTMGKAEAHAFVKSACRTAVRAKKHLKEVLISLDVALEKADLDNLFNPEHATGRSQEIIDSILNRDHV